VRQELQVLGQSGERNDAGKAAVLVGRTDRASVVAHRAGHASGRIVEDLIARGLLRLERQRDPLNLTDPNPVR